MGGHTKCRNNIRDLESALSLTAMKMLVRPHEEIILPKFNYLRVIDSIFFLNAGNMWENANFGQFS